MDRAEHGTQCGRETRVLKYTGGSGDLSFAASVIASPDSAGIESDAFDQIKLGINYAIGDYTRSQAH